MLTGARVLLLGVLLASAAHATTRIDTGEFGSVEIFTPAQTITSFAFVFSGAAGRQQDDIQAVQELVSAGAQVALIDVRETLKILQKLDQDCVDLPGPLEWISRNAQHQAGVAKYIKPMLFGRETGGDLVYVALAQAPPLSFTGGESIGFSGRWPLRKPPPCHLQTSAQGDTALLLHPGQSVHGQWLLVPDATGVTPALQPFMASATPMNVDASHAQTPALLYTAAVVKLGAAPGDTAQDVNDLPIVEVSSKSSTGTLVVIYSGDGGWRDLDKSLGETLAEKDYAVIGVDVLHYFWARRTPDETARDLARLLRHYLESWDCQHIVLIGYSFGADILPFAYNRLPEPLRQQVLLLSLLAPGRGASFEIHLEEWFASDTPDDTLPLAPETARIEASKLQCFYGIEDSKESLCRDSSMHEATVERTAGGHHFDENYDALAGRIELAIRARLRNAGIN